jgi:molybdopterin adenylyltransferase
MLRIGKSLLEITQIGKECHTRCAIYYRAGDCVMPREGIFARVLIGGAINVGDEVEVLHDDARQGDAAFCSIPATELSPAAIDLP